MISLPGNLRREKANAPKIVVIAVQIVLAIITNTELKKYFPKGAIPKAVIKFFNEKPDGQNFGGFEIISSWVLKELRNIHKNGKNIIREEKIKIT